MLLATVALGGVVSVMRRMHLALESTGAPVADAPPAVMRSRSPAPSVPSPPESAAAPGPTTSVGAPVAIAPAAITAHLRARALLVPVRGVEVTDLRSTFAETRGARTHQALDIMAPAGTPVQAVEDGTVARLFTSDAGGLTVYQFDPSRLVAYYYAHLQRYAPGLSDGAAVRRGQVLGYVGSSGNADPAAPHLHFAISVLGPEQRWWEGTPIDPYEVLR